ncbi:MAG: hypothetical protein Q4B28_07750 [bacterium]|nr:hypothetical protein [bacterium]
MTILLPISGMKFPDYVIQIGLRYFTIPIFAITVGAILHKKFEKKKEKSD